MDMANSKPPLRGFFVALRWPTRSMEASMFSMQRLVPAMEARNTADGSVTAFDEALHQMGAGIRAGYAAFHGFCWSVHRADAVVQRQGCARERIRWNVPSNRWKHASP